MRVCVRFLLLVLFIDFPLCSCSFFSSHSTRIHIQHQHSSVFVFSNQGGVGVGVGVVHCSLTISGVSFTPTRVYCTTVHMSTSHFLPHPHPSLCSHFLPSLLIHCSCLRVVVFSPLLFCLPLSLALGTYCSARSSSV